MTTTLVVTIGNNYKVVSCYERCLHLENRNLVIIKRIIERSAEIKQTHIHGIDVSNQNAPLTCYRLRKFNQHRAMSRNLPNRSSEVSRIPSVRNRYTSHDLE